MSDTTTIPDSRPGVDAWWQMILNEGRMVARDTGGLVVPLGLPILILVMNGMGQTSEPIPELGGMSAMNAFVVPLTLAMIVAMTGIINMPSHLAGYRHMGILRRLGVTPATPTMVLVAQVVVNLFQTLLGMGIALGVGVAAFDVVGPQHWGGAIATTFLTVAAMYAIGMVIAALSPTPNSSVALGLVTFFGFAALGGMFGPTENLPEALARAGEVLPFGAAVEALSTSWAGEFPDLLHLGSLAVAFVVATALAAKFFRWEK